MQHARSVTLILSLSTGNVSPQYHCHMDDTFDTVVGSEAKLIPKSKWQVKTKFKSEGTTVTQKEGKIISPTPGNMGLQTTGTAEVTPRNEGDVFVPEQEAPQQDFDLPPNDDIQQPQPTEAPQPVPVREQPDLNVRRSGRQ
jgi:hypothetical protein